MGKRISILLLAALLLFSAAACRKKTAAAPAATEAPAATAAPTDPPVDEPADAPAGEYAIEDPLLKGAPEAPDNARVFYEIFVGSFSDSDGDGIGDLRGIINRFDYLNDGDPDSVKSLSI